MEKHEIENPDQETTWIIREPPAVYKADFRQKTTFKALKQSVDGADIRICNGLRRLDRDVFAMFLIREMPANRTPAAHG